MLSSAPLNARSMLSLTANLNKPLEQIFRDFLSATVADKSQHTRFLNLLSLLEHMGSRKIMLSQMKGILTQDILKHLAEETRHAFFFKREAEKMLGAPIEGYPDTHTLGAASGRLYFGRLDAILGRDFSILKRQRSNMESESLASNKKAERDFSIDVSATKNHALTGDLPPDTHTETAYLWMSLIVELRALWVYHMYQETLVAAKHPLSLKSIIAEEDRHLSDMVERLNEIGFDTEAALESACHMEKRLFEKLLSMLHPQAQQAA